MPYERFNILGVPVDAVTESQVLDFVRKQIDRGDPAQIVTVNAEFVVLARRNAEFAQVLQGAQLATPDGAGVVWAMRRNGVRLQRRVGGADLIWSMAEQAARCGHRAFLLGAAEGVAAAAAANLQRRFPRLWVAGAYPGSPERTEEAFIVDLIQHSRADLLFVAFGAPEQDIWIARNMPSTGVTIAIGVGGSFDYVAGTARRAPLWMREHGLEWLWRLVRQPWRGRRMLALPLFVLLVAHAELGERVRERMKE